MYIYVDVDVREHVHVRLHVCVCVHVHVHVHVDVHILYVEEPVFFPEFSVVIIPDSAVLRNSAEFSTQKSMEIKLNSEKNPPSAELQKPTSVDTLVVRYHCGGWSQEVNSCILISYMVYL
jgi:hypothetical protein